MFSKRRFFFILSFVFFSFALSCSGAEEIAKQNESAAKAVMLEALSDESAVQKMEAEIDEQVRLQDEFERFVDEEPIVAMPNK